MPNSYVDSDFDATKHKVTSTFAQQIGYVKSITWREPRPQGAHLDREPNNHNKEHGKNKRL